MKPKSPQAARCPVPAKLPEPRLMRTSRTFLKSPSITCYADTGVGLHVALIPLHTRQSKAQLRAVQRLLSMSEAERVKIALDAAYNDPAGPAQNMVRLYITDGLRALGLISKPGQHAGEIGKKK